MKKYFLGLLGASLLTTISCHTYADALQWAYDTKILEKNAPYQADAKITREAFAPILLRYIKNVAQKDYTTYTCKARDLSIANPIYQNDLQTLCSYGILNGEKGSLYPLWELNNGQTVALIMRVIDGLQDESTTAGRHRAQGYYDKAAQLGFNTKNLIDTKNSSITYQNMLDFLYSTSTTGNSLSYSSSSSTNSQDPLITLMEIIK